MGGGGDIDEVFYNFDGTKVTKLKIKIEKSGNYGLGYIDGDISEDKPTIIDWGNGTKTTLTTPITNKDQANNSTDFYVNYSKPGEYIISIDGWYSQFRCNDYYIREVGATPISNILVDIVQVSSLITSFYDTFHGCSSLTSIPSNLFDKNTNVTSFEKAFSFCESLASIPSGLFDNNISVTNFSYTFSYCSSLTSIPSGLFDNNTSVTSFYGTFNGCSSLTSIPSELFNKNTSVTIFYSTFIYCSSLKTIPTGLFDKNINVKSFESTFSSCSGLTSIPTGLFDKNINVKSFENTFSSCSNLTGETPYTKSSDDKKIKLWDRDGTNGFVKPTSTRNAFYGCNGLDDFNKIPDSWK